MKRAKAAILAATLLVAGIALPGAAAADEETLLARRGRGADDVYEHRGDDHYDGGTGVDTAPPAQAPPPATVADADAKALFEEKCSMCHLLSRPLSRNRERKWWVETVTRMQRVNGCPITDEEARTIIDYLARIRGPAGG